MKLTHTDYVEHVLSCFPNAEDMNDHEIMFRLLSGMNMYILSGKMKRYVRKCIQETPRPKSAFWIWAQDVEATI